MSISENSLYSSSRTALPAFQIYLTFWLLFWKANCLFSHLWIEYFKLCVYTCMHAKEICGKGVTLGTIGKALAWNQRFNRTVGCFHPENELRVTGRDSLMVTAVYWPWRPACLLQRPLDHALAMLQWLQQWNNVLQEFWTVSLCEKRGLTRWDLTKGQVIGYYRGECRDDCCL